MCQEVLIGLRKSKGQAQGQETGSGGTEGLLVHPCVKAVSVL